MFIYVYDVNGVDLQSSNALPSCARSFHHFNLIAYFALQQQQQLPWVSEYLLVSQSDATRQSPALHCQHPGQRAAHQSN